MTLSIDNMMDLLKKTFQMQEIKQEGFVHGFFSGRATKFFIPKEKVESLVKEFPFMRNALKSGLIAKDKKSGGYFTTDKILSVKATDKRRSREAQFFSINGDDDHERTTLFDILSTIQNLRYISEKFGMPAKDIKFSIGHENGNPAKVVNNVELDKRIFGNNEQDIKNNINKLNSMVEYRRKSLTEEVANV